MTIGQLLGMAAHLEGKGCSVLDMAGLAQKGGAVYSHVVLAKTPELLLNTRVAMSEADLVLARDLVVGTSQDAVARMRPGRTRMLLNSDVAPTAEFVSTPPIGVFPVPICRQICKPRAARVMSIR